MPNPDDHPDYPLTVRQVDQARGDFAAILAELDFVKWQRAQVPDRAWLGRMLLLGFGSVWAMFGVRAVWLAR